jgi:hypothetical protein
VRVTGSGPSTSAPARRKRRAAAERLLASPAVRSAPAPAKRWLARLLTQGERASGPDAAVRKRVTDQTTIYLSIEARRPG